MSRIHSKNKKPEEIVRKYFYSCGLRYRKNDKRYPGCPDIVLPKYKTVIFVNGCFWHMHEGNPCFFMPKTRRGFWDTKLNRNQQRDMHNTQKLVSMGWRVIVVWECELKPKLREKHLAALVDEIINGVPKITSL